MEHVCADLEHAWDAGVHQRLEDHLSRSGAGQNVLVGRARATPDSAAAPELGS